MHRCIFDLAAADRRHLNTIYLGVFEAVCGSIREAARRRRSMSLSRELSRSLKPALSANERA